MIDEKDAGSNGWIGRAVKQVMLSASDIEQAGPGKHELVMPGLVPGIHVLQSRSKKDVDGRDSGERKRRRPSDGYARP
jgi:hypothetical protein